MATIFLQLASIIFFFSSSPLTFRFRMISLLVVLVQHREVAEVFCAWWGCCKSWTSCHNPCRHTHGHCVTKLCANYELERTWKPCHIHYRDENSFFLLCFVIYTNHIQQQHEFPHKLARNTYRFRCQQMSIPRHVLLKSWLLSWRWCCRWQTWFL